MAIARALVALALVVTACAAPSPEPAARLGRAIAAMEALAGLRFELRATVVASGAASPITTEARMVGEYQAPDRLHVTVFQDGARTDLVLVERRTYVDTGSGYRQSVRVPVGPLRDARAPITFLRGGGAASFAGLGFARGSVTYRVRLDLSAGDLAARSFEGRSVPPDAKGTVEVEIGLFDDLVRRQTVEIVSSAEGAGSGLDRVRTAYTVEYWAHGERVEVGEPE
ncbi:MAG TPA: hypothetical protein VFM93_01900 [Candidatus Limnocylindria bacterium]|nr:hypothetical protein [Candidatus Limnocylindria bacterium]